MTFVELLIAAMMFALLSVGLSYQLRGGITVWRRSQAATGHSQQRRLLLDTLNRDCRNAILVDESGVTWKPEFSSDRVSFATLQPMRAGDRDELVVVTYLVEGERSPTLLRRWQPYAEALGQRRAGLRTMALLDRIAELRFRYAYARPSPKEGEPAWLWKDHWQKAAEWKPEDGLPRFIEVTITRAPGESVERTTQGPALAMEPAPLTAVMSVPAGILKKDAAP